MSMYDSNLYYRRWAVFEKMGDFGRKCKNEIHDVYSIKILHMPANLLWKKHPKNIRNITFTRCVHLEAYITDSRTLTNFNGDESRKYYLSYGVFFIWSY